MQEQRDMIEEGMALAVGLIIVFVAALIAVVGGGI